jgi:hypothetical protein
MHMPHGLNVVNARKSLHFPSKLPPHSILQYHHPPTVTDSTFNSHLFVTSEMSDRSGSARFQVIFEASLQEYEKQTGIALAKHPLAQQLQHCDSVESVSAILQEKLLACSEFRGNDRLSKSLNSVVSVLSKLSASVNLGLVRPKVLTGCSISLMFIL